MLWDTTTGSAVGGRAEHALASHCQRGSAPKRPGDKPERSLAALAASPQLKLGQSWVPDPV